jgi:hypothetical protein
MGNNQFSILYNGHPVNITVLGNNAFMAQVTYKPLQITLQKNGDGLDRWIDLETKQETALSTELGRLIGEYLHHCQPV